MSLNFVKRILLLVSVSAAGVLSDVSNEFVEANICSDTNTKPPQKLLQVTYGDIDVNPGDKLGDDQVALQPLISFSGNAGSYYTLVMFDPDVPEPVSQFAHWIVGNIEDCDINKGKVVAPYFPPTTAPGKNGRLAHRYIFLVYEHKQKVEFDLENMAYSVERPLFDISDFATKHNFNDPKFGNYFNGVLVNLEMDSMPDF